MRRSLLGREGRGQARRIDKAKRTRHNTHAQKAEERVKMAEENATFLRSREQAQVEMRPGVHRRVLGTTAGVMLTEFFLERDADVPEHTHPHEQVGYVVDGRMALTIAGETREVVDGDSYAIEAGVTHSAHAVTDVILVEVFAPPREDFVDRG
jgi:quercetin dioxygenase-like cupin family protein